MPQDVTKVLNTILGTRGIAVSCSELQENIVACIDAPSGIQELEAVLLQMMEEIKKGLEQIVLPGSEKLSTGLNSCRSPIHRHGKQLVSGSQRIIAMCYSTAA